MAITGYPSYNTRTEEGRRNLIAYMQDYYPTLERYLEDQNDSWLDGVRNVLASHLHEMNLGKAITGLCSAFSLAKFGGEELFNLFAVTRQPAGKEYNYALVFCADNMHTYHRTLNTNQARRDWIAMVITAIEAEQASRANGKLS